MPDCASRVSPSFPGVKTSEMYHFKKKINVGEYITHFCLDLEEIMLQQNGRAIIKNQNILISISYHIYNAQGYFSKKKKTHYLLSRQIRGLISLASSYFLGKMCFQLYWCMFWHFLCPQVLGLHKREINTILKKYGTDSSVRIFVS